MATQPLGQQKRGIRLPLLDSNIVILILRGNEQMVQFYNQLVELFGQNLAVSVVTVYEVLAGMRPGEEQKTKEFLGKLKCLPVTEEIAEKAAEYRRDFRAKGRTLLAPDLLIAATAFCHKLCLYTLNQKDFPMTDITKEVPSASP